MTRHYYGDIEGNFTASEWATLKDAYEYFLEEVISTDYMCVFDDECMPFHESLLEKVKKVEAHAYKKLYRYSWLKKLLWKASIKREVLRRKFFPEKEISN